MMDLEKAKQAAQAGAGEPEGLTSIEKDTIGEILNISMGAGATAISTLLGMSVSITTPIVTMVKTREFEVHSMEPAIGIEIQYIEGLDGSNLLVMKSKDIRAIVSQILSDDSGDENEELNEMHMSAISEIMNQMMGASSTALSTFLGNSINISTPSEFDIQEINDKLEDSGAKENVVSVRFLLHIENLLDSEFITVMPLEFTKSLVSKAMNMGDAASAPAAPAPQPAQAPPAPPAPTPAAAPIPAPIAAPIPAPAPQAPPVPKAAPVMAPPAPRPAPINVQPMQLTNFDDGPAPGDGSSPDNFDLIMDVPLDLSVEIGRTKMQVKNILELRQGSIVELDKQAGDPVDIFVNGRIIAKGDVVIINDNFGMRITEIISGNPLTREVNRQA